MIEWIVFIILIIFFAYAVQALMASVVVFLVNGALIFVIGFRAYSDIQDRDMYRYYLLAGLITVFLYLIKDAGPMSVIFSFMKNVAILEVVQVMVLVFIIANLLNLGFNSVSMRLERYKKGSSTKEKPVYKKIDQKNKNI